MATQPVDGCVPAVRRHWPARRPPWLEFRTWLPGDPVGTATSGLIRSETQVDGKAIVFHEYGPHDIVEVTMIPRSSGRAWCSATAANGSMALTKTLAIRLHPRASHRTPCDPDAAARRRRVPDHQGFG